MTLQHGNRIRRTGGKQAVRELQDLETLEPVSDAPTETEIRQRAYEIYLSRDGTPGGAEVDWLQAECELRAERVTTTRYGEAE